MKRTKKNKQKKDKSLLRKFIEVAWEQGQRRKALRILSQQEWSVEFLIYLLVRASQLQQRGLELIVQKADGTTLRLSSSNPGDVMDKYGNDDNILDHLDEPEVVDAYIRRNGR